MTLAVPLAMQKVEGSSPFSRSHESPGNPGFFVGSRRVSSRVKTVRVPLAGTTFAENGRLEVAGGVSGQLGAAAPGHRTAHVGQVRLEVLTAEAHRSPDPQVWEPFRPRQLVHRRDRQPQQLGNLTRGEQLALQADRLVAHLAIADGAGPNIQVS